MPVSRKADLQAPPSSAVDLPAFDPSIQDEDLETPISNNGRINTVEVTVQDPEILFSGSTLSQHSELKAMNVDSTRNGLGDKVQSLIDLDSAEMFIRSSMDISQQRLQAAREENGQKADYVDKLPLKKLDRPKRKHILSKKKTKVLKLVVNDSEL